jgi:hypothetical protein
MELALAAEYMSCDRKYWLFNKVRSDYSASFPHIFDRSRFNRRKKAIFPKNCFKSRRQSFSFNPGPYFVDEKPFL